jgi:hypothetical protein
MRVDRSKKKRYLDCMGAAGRTGPFRPSPPPLPGQSLGKAVRLGTWSDVPSVRPDELDDEETVQFDASHEASRMLRHPSTDLGEIPPSGARPSRSTFRGLPASSPASEPRPVPASLEATDSSERDFLESAPRYAPESVAPPLSLAPRPRRSPVRSAFAKLLFFAIFASALLLLAYVISIRLHVAWLDPRPLLVRVQRFVLSHVPLHRLPKLPRL